jgi:hypothetical protein
MFWRRSVGVVGVVGVGEGVLMERAMILVVMARIVVGVGVVSVAARKLAAARKLYEILSVYY